MTEALKNNRMKIGVGVLLLSFALLVSHTDGILLTNWAKMFWDCVLAGRCFEYSDYVKELGYWPINYSIFLTMVNAIWMAPVYFLDYFLPIAFHDYIFQAWMKLLILFAVLLCAYVMYQLFLLRKVDASRAVCYVLLFLICGTVLHGNVGDGQEDCWDALFLFLSLYYMQKRDYTKMSLAGGMLMVCKGRGLLFFIPIFLLLYGKELKNLVKHALLMLVPYVISFFLTHVVFIHYAKNSAEMNAQWHNIWRLFDPKIGDIPLFLGIYGVVCIICWSRAIRGCVKDWDYVLYPLIILFAYVAFLNWTSYWLIYPMVFVFEAMEELKNRDDALLAFTGFNIGYYAYVFTHHVGSDDNVMFNFGILSMTGHGEVYRNYMGIINDLMPDMYVVLPSAATAVVAGFALYLVFAYARDVVWQKSLGNESVVQARTYWTTIFVVVNVLIPVLYLITGLLIYFRG